MAAGCVMATSAAAAPSVTVDWSVIAALGPAPLHPGLAPVTLHPPQAQAASPVVPASLSPMPAPGRVSAVRFVAGSTELSPDGRRFLDAVAHVMAANAQLRVRLVAHAAGESVDARRLSMVRAVEMRSYLLDKGVPSDRMVVRALGSQSDGGANSLDRVDVDVLDR